MKAQIRGQKLEGYLGPDMGKGRWLFVRSKKSGRTYPVARTVNGEIVEIDNERALRDFSNEEVANALMSAES